MVLLSIVLTINSERYLEDCLNSIFSQKYVDFEVICIDAVHSEYSEKIITEHLENSRLKLIENENNGETLNETKNRAINESSGTYLSFLTSNNVLYDHETISQISKILDENSAPLISFNTVQYDENIAKINSNPFFDPEFTTYDEICEKKSNEYGIPYLLSRNIIRKDILINNNIQFQNIYFGSENIFLSEILVKIPGFICVPTIFIRENVENGEIDSNLIIGYLQCYKTFLKTFNNKEEFIKVLERISDNLVKIKNISLDNFSYKEYKMLENEVDEIIDICNKHTYSFSYIIRRTLRYLKNRLYNKITVFDVLISIIIPSYNVEEYIDDCLLSLINQSFENFEVIIVDDSSTDSTVEIIEYYERIDPRIKYIEKKEKSGSGGSRNCAMQYARGKYIQFLDADDWLDLNTLEKLYSYAEKYETDIVMFKLINYDTEEGNFYKNRYYSIPSLNDYVDTAFNLDDVEKELFRIAVSPVNKMYSRSYLESINVKFPEKYVHQDNPFFYQTFCDAEKVYLTDEYFYNRRRTNSSISTRLDDTQIGTIEIVEYMLNVFINNNLYEKFKKPLLNRLVYKIRNRSKQVGDEFKEEYYKKAKRKLFKFMFTYGLDDDLNENLYGENKRYFEKILSSENYEKFLEIL